jgi:hypothetical protein
MKMGIIGIALVLILRIAYMVYKAWTSKAEKEKLK